MRFIDSNIFLYAIIKPKGKIDPEILERKEKSRKILLRIKAGEEVVTTVIHLSEVANILEAKTNLQTSINLVKEVLLAKNIIVLPVSTMDYLKAVVLAEEKKVSINDALAYLKMKENNIKEIYTFDEHFRNLDVTIVNE